MKAIVPNIARIVITTISSTRVKAWIFEIFMVGFVKTKIGSRL